MSIAGRVAEIIAEHGETITYKRKTSRARNDTTLVIDNTFSDTTTVAHVRKYSDRELSGLIQQGDREMRIGADQITFEPSDHDIAVIDGAEFNIVSFDTRVDRNVKIEYIFHIRGQAPQVSI